MDNKISISYGTDAYVEVDVELIPVCAKCGESLKTEYDRKTRKLSVTPCKKCSGLKILTPEVLEEVRAKFGEEVFQFLDLKRMLQE